ncbi:MAG: histone deacetylase [Thermoleophilia bacterium]|nr:histone deacetylase [Thermoleophilia bacterium]
MNPIGIYYHPLFLEHETGDHPESKQRLIVAKRVLEQSGLDLEWITPEPAPVPAIARVHEQAYIDSVRELAYGDGGWLDWDTAVSPKSYEAAVHAAGAGLMAVDRALSAGQNAFMLVRPPGHHACRSRGMGFCLFDNIAIAAAYALQELGLERVLIVDWDVHHGNGTQAAFYDDPRVIYLSTHLAGHFPGTGMVREVGTGDGAGFTVNVPLQTGAGDGTVSLVFETLLVPLARAFRPQLVLVSAGYDPQKGDPLGGLCFSQDAFQWMGACLRGLCEELGASGPLVFLEGGYIPEMMAASIVATLKGMQGEALMLDQTASADERADVREALEEIKPYWKGAF